MSIGKIVTECIAVELERYARYAAEGKVKGNKSYIKGYQSGLSTAAAVVTVLLGPKYDKIGETK